MEQILERLNNSLAKQKTSWPITIKGRIENEDGSFTYILRDPLDLDDDGTYLVWLWNFTGWSNFPNVLDSGAHQNNKFYYSKPDGTMRTIVFPESLHDVDTYNAYIRNRMTAFGDSEPPDSKNPCPIRLSYDLPTQRIVLTLERGFKVHFEKENTWRRRLGFEARLYEGNGAHIAENRADIVETLNIFIESDICYGWSYGGYKTNILYAIVNSQPAGTMLIERPNPPVKVPLNSRKISSIRLRFFTDDDTPVDFNGEEFVLNIVIERM